MRRAITNRLTFSIGKNAQNATERDWFHAIAFAVRDQFVQNWMETRARYQRSEAKRVYYLSLEFLIGRTLVNSLHSTGVYDVCQDAVRSFGLEMEQVRELEYDAALGNGGLGRLAACFLDSIATLGLPGYGYGIRYEYGMFHQEIEDGNQVEHPDNWLRYGNPWEFPRPEILFPVKFGGHIVQYRDANCNVRHHWNDAEEVMAMAYDTPVPGYGNSTVNLLRLWSAKATRDFELKYFNQGDYIKAVAEKNESENLSKVLYPNDTTQMGKTLRLKQQYFFVSASLQDILQRFSYQYGSFDVLPDKISIQLNDTHPSIAIPELMRILIDEHFYAWDRAWDISRRTFSYTNHTLMPEALETWPVSLIERILPRHMQLIYEINHSFLKEVAHHHPGNPDLLRHMSIIEEEGEKRVRMAHLAIVGSHKVNGVARLHTELMKTTIFADFHRFFPGRIVNMTNGITPRLWLNQANPGLTELISQHIGKTWITDLDQLKQLAPLALKSDFRKQFHAVKYANKQRLAALIQHHLDIHVNANSMFDVQIKRMHEYKRQLLNLLHVITRYNRIRHNPATDIPARTVIFSGKAAPGYFMAKLIIKLINDVADIVNNDPAVHHLLKVVFIPNYDVSTALDIIPAADLSEQISTAGTEASGTGNMKLALNGALTIGTLDGANIEIGEEVGDDNIFIFGHTASEVTELRSHGYNPWDYYHGNAELKEALDMLSSGYFCPDEPHRFQPIVDTLTTHGDHYLLLADYASYIECQDKVDALYRDTDEWTRKAILNVAGMGKFSSDRTISQYAEEIWQVKPMAPRQRNGEESV